MSYQSAKLSEIMRDMSERLLRNPDGVSSLEAAQVALFFANVAWNETVGLDNVREHCWNAWEKVAAEKPDLGTEFKLHDIGAMLDELVNYKQQHFPDDRRRILACGIPDGEIHVEWLPAADPGVDSKWEMRLYGLVRTGQRQEAIRYLQETRRMSRKEAAKRVTTVASDLGLG